jgi:hypothetical protein
LPLDDDGGAEKGGRQVARIQLRRVKFRAAAPDLPGTGEPQSRPSSEGSISERGQRVARSKPTSSVALEIESRLARLDRESPFALLGVEPATLEGKEERVVTELLWQAYEEAARWHPDQCPKNRPELREGMTKLYGAISQAFETLTDPESRASCAAAAAGPSEESPADSDSGGLRPSQPADDPAAREVAVPSTAEEGAEEGDGQPPPGRVESTLSPSQLHERALNALAEDRASEALEFGQQACDSEPDNPDYLATVLWIRSKLPRPDFKVLTLDLDDLLRSHMDHVAARYYRGVLRRRLAYDSAAKQDFERVLDLDPDHAGARAQLVEIGKPAGRRR